MLKLAILSIAALAVAETVLIHPGQDDWCIRADDPAEREQLSFGDDVRQWDIEEANPTLIRLHGTDVCLTGGVHRTWEGELFFDPEDGDHVVLRACPEGHRIPDGYAWVRHDGERGLSFKLDLEGDAWYLDAASGAAVFIAKNEEPALGWTLEAVGGGDGDGDEDEGPGGKQRIEFWAAVGDVLGHVV